MGGQAANLTALLLTAIANTAANWTFTFGIRGTGVARHQLHGLLVFVFGLAITSGSLFVLHSFDPTVGKVVELSVLVVANLVTTVVIFVALRRVFGSQRGARGVRPASYKLSAGSVFGQKAHVPLIHRVIIAWMSSIDHGGESWWSR